MSTQPIDKKQRLTALAKKLAKIIHEDEQKHGDLKPSYRSLKFWAYIEHEMKQIKNDDS